LCLNNSLNFVAIAISHLQKRDRINKLDFIGLLLSIQSTDQRSHRRYFL